MITNEVISNQQIRSNSDPSSFAPTQMLDIELSHPLPYIYAKNAHTKQKYKRAQLLVRLHTSPLGLVEINLAEDTTPPEVYAKQIWSALSQKINDHLSQDQLQKISHLDVTGMPSNEQVKCLHDRDQFLKHPPFVSVIVCTRDRSDLLARCLDSLLEMEYPSFEIIVVDNAPQTQATEMLIRSYHSKFPAMRYAREDRPGLSWARNCGIQYASGEFVAFTDDDVVVDTHWLTEIVRGFGNSEEIAAVTGLTIPAELNTPSQHWFEQFSSFNNGFSRVTHNLTIQRLPHPLYPFSAARFGTGVNMAFRRPILVKLGGFNTNLGVGTPTCGGEDVELYLRVIEGGFTLVYEPNALIRHFHRDNFESLRKQVSGYGISFTAYLIAFMLQKPRFLFFLFTRLPYVLFSILSKKAPRYERRADDFPQELIYLERKGMLYGPVAYLRSMWKQRTNTKSSFT